METNIIVKPVFLTGRILLATTLLGVFGLLGLFLALLYDVWFWILGSCIYALIVGCYYGLRFVEWHFSLMTITTTGVTYQQATSWINGKTSFIEFQKIRDITLSSSPCDFLLGQSLRFDLPHRHVMHDVSTFKIHEASRIRSLILKQKQSVG